MCLRQVQFPPWTDPSQNLNENNVELKGYRIDQINKLLSFLQSKWILFHVRKRPIYNLYLRYQNCSHQCRRRTGIKGQHWFKIMHSFQCCRNGFIRNNALCPTNGSKWRGNIQVVSARAAGLVLIFGLSRYNRPSRSPVVRNHATPHLQGFC